MPELYTLFYRYHRDSGAFKKGDLFSREVEFPDHASFHHSVIGIHAMHEIVPFHVMWHISPGGSYGTSGDSSACVVPLRYNVVKECGGVDTRHLHEMIEKRKDVATVPEPNWRQHFETRY
jgi:hypothetical protein